MKLSKKSKEEDFLLGPLPSCLDSPGYSLKRMALTILGVLGALGATALILSLVECCF